MIDLKSLTLQLFHKEVKVIFKQDAESLKKYGKSLKGKLIRRIWEDNVDLKKEDKVIGITVKSGLEEIDIMCSEIKKLEPL